MPEPTRPLTGAAIEATWGQEVHDGIFTPTGGRWRSTSGAISTTADIGLTAITDPGGWLATPGAALLTVPADGGGLYLISGVGKPSTGQASHLWRWALKRNTVEVGGAATFTDTAVTNTWIIGTFVYPLVAGDVLAVALVGAPSSGRFDMPSLTVTRIGHAWGVA